MSKQYIDDNKFQIKSENEDFIYFFYDFFKRTIIIECKLRDFENKCLEIQELLNISKDESKN